MRVCDLVGQLNLKVFCGEQGLQKKVTGAYVSDLMSDVMGNVKEDELWITLQTHKNIMAIASLKEVAAVVLVKGYRPEQATIDQSNKEGIPILGTHLQTFEIAGLLYDLMKNRE
ncbi:DRTGG domain-containing protein [Saccharicrinis fermentans]|uniref:DRTGG domain protein n=1 Tax=Saccharicrinis fermentans DSM 9555 = JCM 21142 TaxID=869213 RepID=W7Y698_9BACT|nr:DRTGG domain-containing protein [Saccharicrinis fermentans]GAF03143.1 DRTGG domain protein [Saccharicrinis fermentans DSM 9555 = JCM 21142]